MDARITSFIIFFLLFKKKVVRKMSLPKVNWCYQNKTKEECLQTFNKNSLPCVWSTSPVEKCTSLKKAAMRDHTFDFLPRGPNSVAPESLTCYPDPYGSVKWGPGAGTYTCE